MGIGVMRRMWCILVRLMGGIDRVRVVVVVLDVVWGGEAGCNCCCLGRAYLNSL